MYARARARMLFLQKKKTFLTVQSSEQDAIMLSLNGFHFMSKTGPVWPVTRLALKSRRPVCNIEMYEKINIDIFTFFQMYQPTTQITHAIQR